MLRAVVARHKVRAWTERSGEPVTSELEIAAGTNEKDLNLAAAGGPSISPDKFGTPRQ